MASELKLAHMLIRKGIDQIGFAGRKLAVYLTHPGFIDRYLMKITRP